MVKVPCLVLTLFAVVAWFSPVVSAQTTEFVFQGSLKNGGTPATGNYDFEFLLYDAVSGGTQFGSTLTRPGVAVDTGTFSVKLDFGGQFPGANRFLEIRVRQSGGGAFTPLSPRQMVNSSPYSVQSLNAANATNATTATTATNALQLGGVGAGQYVVTTDPRMSDPRPPTAGSSSYIQNTTSPQASSNFNINGTGTANILNATTQYNIGGSRVLSVAGASNTFAGRNAGLANTMGFSNSFIGANAGDSNLEGGYNSFVGAFAGQGNTSGEANSFFGLSAGYSNTTGGNNTIIGVTANVGSGGLNYATAIGSGAVVSTSNTVVLGRTADNVRVPGTLTVTGAGAASSLHIVTNGGNVLVGNVGCGFSSTGISFSPVLICNNYSILGDGTGTSLNRPFGGNLDFRENNSVQMSIASGGIVSLFNLGPAGATTLCRNASFQIATCSSSARYKSNINPFTSGLSLINRLRPVSFRWRDGGMLDMGLVAEEVAAVEPLLTTTNDKGEIEGVKYDRVGVVLINAVKEQQAQIELLRAEIASLKEIICAANPTTSVCKK